MSTILYAEDDRDCRELFAFALRHKGHSVHEALNGAQAVQIVREESIDLVILDARMPMVTGYEAAKLIGRENPNLPVIFLSARGLRREIDLAYESSPMVVDYLLKPVSPEELTDRVETIIRDCQHRGIEAVRAENMIRELVVEW
jgi:two-component system OmpR family response regulator